MAGAGLVLQLVRRPWVVGLVAAAVLWPLLAPQVAHFYGALAAIYALVGLSLVILVGWTGQVSLGHAAFLGFGCYIGAKLLAAGMPLILALLIVAGFGALVSLFLGIPSLRLRGVYLTIATLAFGAACQRFLFVLPSVRGVAAQEVPRSPLLFVPTTTDRGLYYAVLLVLVACMLLAYNVRRSDVGRVLFAIRDSEAAAQAMAVRIAPYKIGVFAASAALATLAGTFYGMLFQATPGPDQFGVLQSLFLLAMPVIGGAEALLGAVIGGTFLAVGQPLVNALDLRLYLVTAVTLLAVLLSGHDGVTGIARAARRALRHALSGAPAARYGSFVPDELLPAATTGPPVVRVRAAVPVPAGTVLRLRVTGQPAGEQVAAR
jgi:branched-chain amino acid transport system permease protein